MWRAVFLLFLFSEDYYRLFASANEGFYSEGGSFSNNKRRQENDNFDYPATNFGARQRYAREGPAPYYPQPQQLQQRQFVDGRGEKNLQNIVEQLRNQRNTNDYDSYRGFTAENDEPSNEDETLAELEELRKVSEKIKQLEEGSSAPSQTFGGSPEYEQVSANEKFGPEDMEYARQVDSKVHHPASERPLSAEKKGQSEFVGFVAPELTHLNYALKGAEYLEKRVPVDSTARVNRGRPFGFISSSSNIVFLAFVAMCCVMSVVGVVGGMYYYNHVRNAREDPFDDFTRYSPAGPGRDRLKRGGEASGRFGGSPLGGAGGEKGDDALAYKAQLHHYQQTKQKIIGGDGASVVGGAAGVAGANDLTDKSDDEDDGADLEHNFSVYECPGLAPTGDIEVQNPNFVEVVPK